MTDMEVELYLQKSKAAKKWTEHFKNLLRGVIKPVYDTEHVNVTRGVIFDIPEVGKYCVTECSKIHEKSACKDICFFEKRGSAEIDDFGWVEEADIPVPRREMDRFLEFVRRSGCEYIETHEHTYVPHVHIKCRHVNQLISLLKKIFD